MSILRRLVCVITTIRPHNCILASASVLIASFLGAGTIGARSVVAAVVTFLVCAGAYTLNDLHDLASDRIVKPWRPIASGRLGRRTAITLVVLFWGLGGILSFAGGRWTPAFWASWSFLLFLYSWRLKSLGLIGHVAVSVVASSGFLLGALVVGHGVAGLVPFGIAASFHLSREIVKAVVDVEGDRRTGVLTVAVRIGERRSLGLVLWCMAVAGTVSVLPYAMQVYGHLYILPVAIIICPILIVCVRLVLRARNGRQDLGQASCSVALALKFAMPAGLLAFLLAGV